MPLPDTDIPFDVTPLIACTCAACKRLHRCPLADAYCAGVDSSALEVMRWCADYNGPHTDGDIWLSPFPRRPGSATTCKVY